MFSARPAGGVQVHVRNTAQGKHSHHTAMLRAHIGAREGVFLKPGIGLQGKNKALRISANLMALTVRRKGGRRHKDAYRSTGRWDTL